MECRELTRDRLIEELRERVIKWEKENWVPYPWRVDRTPYKVLTAELLLKRTTRQAVAREFLKFIGKFHDLSVIYNTPIKEVEEAFRPLGLYKQRARQLKELAEVIVNRYNNRIPDRWEDLVELPGIGVYIAGAVLSFGYGKKAPVIDSNVIRLLTRLTGIKAKRGEEYLKVLWKLVPDVEHEYFNYGLIDLGALICHYRRPKCGLCPLKEFCVFYKENDEKKECLKDVYNELFR